ncbi:DUF3859 domain-containing protein [Planctomycetes bacterium K23_9]|uniref:DUF3859 domain-containing protein n=1 Tax=Stieleria marina TaxID=1930275 RepID=A0A517NQP2_9BACT|nr:hypothetical protein K239x_13920 [Planctomycetes bacterium K23_9]
MARRKPEVRMRSYGVYSKWESSSKELPDLVEVTTEIPAEIDIEFGFIVNIKWAKNSELTFCIDHPGILDAQGQRRSAFDGVVFVKTNDWHFFLGDTIWEPVADKLGPWRLTLELGGRTVAEKTFLVHEPNTD